MSKNTVVPSYPYNSRERDKWSMKTRLLLEMPKDHDNLYYQVARQILFPLPFKA